MSTVKTACLSFLNFIGSKIPKNLQRMIIEFPGILGLFEKISGSEQINLTTAEGYTLIINPLFHANLIQTGDVNGYEPEMRRAIKKYTKKSMVAYDIGANVGVFSYLFLSMVGENGFIYCFEPEKNNYVYLEESILRNNKSNILLDKRAVGISTGLAKFDRRGGAFSGRLVGNGNYQISKNIEEIEIVSIDYLVEKENYRLPDILKIDVEGNELMVLQGMQNVLKHHNPVIICEIHTHLGESSADVFELLTNAGYKITSLQDAISDENNSGTVIKYTSNRHIIALKT